MMLRTTSTTRMIIMTSRRYSSLSFLNYTSRSLSRRHRGCMLIPTTTQNLYYNTTTSSSSSSTAIQQQQQSNTFPIALITTMILEWSKLLMIAAVATATATAVSATAGQLFYTRPVSVSICEGSVNNNNNNNNNKSSNGNDDYHESNDIDNSSKDWESISIQINEIQQQVKHLVDTIVTSNNSFTTTSKNNSSVTNTRNTNNDTDPTTPTQLSLPVWIETISSTILGNKVEQMNTTAPKSISDWIDQMINDSNNSSIRDEIETKSPNVSDNSNKTMHSTTFPRLRLEKKCTNEENFKQIVQSLFNVVLLGTTLSKDNTATTTTTASNTNKIDVNEMIDNEKNTSSATQQCQTFKVLSQSVSTLLEAILLQNRGTTTPISDPNEMSSSSSSSNGTTVMVVQQDDTSSFLDLYTILNTYSPEVEQLVSKYMSYIDYKRITPTAVLYYLDYANTQYESILKERLDDNSNSNSKNIIRDLLFRNWESDEIQEQIVDFLDDMIPTSISNNAQSSSSVSFIDPSIMKTIQQHQDGIDLVKLSYANTVDEIRNGLQCISVSSQYKYELVHCDLKSEPGKPAHFHTIRTNKNKETEIEDVMDIVIVIRGTKTVADAITDLLCDTQPYRLNNSPVKGKAHSYILDSGRYIANRYKPILYNLLSKNKTRPKQNVSKINVTIYGHSLGAGAGAIAAMELYDLNDSKINVQMVGYGCPALLSKDLAKETSEYITTFINDSDLVPRLSGKSLTNMLYDIIEFDWMPLAQKDIQKVLTDLQQRQPILFTNDTINAMTNIINPILQSIHTDTYVESGTIPRFHVELYPPGKCIHIYRNDEQKHSRLASYVPNWFYSKIDVNKHMVDDHLLSSGYIKAISDIKRRNEQDTNDPK